MLPVSGSSPDLTWTQENSATTLVKTSGFPQLPRLPLEICEYIIDSYVDCYNTEWHIKGSYACLCACALTCRGWKKRAHINLYKYIKIVGASQFNKLLSTLRASPSYADLVRRLSIAVDLMGPGGFLPAGTVLVALSNRLKKLDRLDIIYTSVRPHDSFFICAAQYRTVTVLSLSGFAFSCTRDLIRFILLFPELRRLKVVHDDYDAPKPSHLRQALYHVELPHLVALMVEFVYIKDPEAVSPERPVVPHFIKWLAQSSIARHLRNIWITVTIESSDEGAQAATRINGLLRASGDSLRELVIDIQIMSDVEETWKLMNLEGLTLEFNRKLEILQVLQIPWRIMTQSIPSIIASADSRALQAVILTFRADENWPQSVLVNPQPHQYAILTEIDAILGNNHSSLHELVIDPNTGTDESVDKQGNLLDQFPKLHAKGLVHVRSVDANLLYVPNSFHTSPQRILFSDCNPSQSRTQWVLS